MKVFYPGIEGSYAHSVCLKNLDGYTPVSFNSPEKAILSFKDSKEEYDLLLLPFENLIGGKVVDIHLLIFEFNNFFIMNEYYHKIEHCLLSLNTVFEELKEVYSHIQALKQCSRFVEIHKLRPIEKDSTAISAKYITEKKDKHLAAIASKEAAKMYGLNVLKENVQNDIESNITRFICISKDSSTYLPYEEDKKYITSLSYKTRNISAALFKSMLGFSTYNVNIVKLESHVSYLKSQDAAFYLEIEGHPNEEKVRKSLDELRFFSSEMRIMGLYERKYSWT